MEKTFKNFIAENYCNELLAKAVYEQIGADSDEEFFETMENVSGCSCGAAGGFTGFVYYNTVAFWRANKTAIMESLQELADDLGETKISLVLGFNSVKDNWNEDEVGEALYGKYDPDLDGLYNIFAFYALEEVAHRADYFAYECKD